MPRSRFRKTDVARAIKAVQSAGLDVGSVTIQPDGSIVISPKNETSPMNELDKWISANARSSEGVE